MKKVVKPGQIWKDNDDRSGKRTLRVVDVTKTHALVDCKETGRKTEVRLDRMKPGVRGYTRIHVM